MASKGIIKVHMKLASFFILTNLITVTASSKTSDHLTVRTMTDTQGFSGKNIHWVGGVGKSRQVFLINNNRKDPYGLYGGYIRSYTYQYQGQARQCVGSHRSHPGFGYTVNHFKSSGGKGGRSVSSRKYKGKYQSIFQGKHHYIHEFSWTLPIGGINVPTYVQWFFSDGLSHPIFRVSYDLRKVKPNTIMADSRSPYGDLQYDGGQKAVVDQIGWGDSWKFETIGSSPITKKTKWTYNKKNLIPYAFSRSNAGDAEMGLVSTQSWIEQDAGGYWFYSYWGKTWKDKVSEQKKKGCSGSYCDWIMPEDWNWAYQIHNYQFQQNPRSKRLAWGTNFGSVGQELYAKMGEDPKKPSAIGYPEQSYSIAVVLGSSKKGLIQKQISRTEAHKKAKWSAIQGRFSKKGKYSIRGSKLVTFNPPGYDPSFGVWAVNSSSKGHFEAKLQKGSKELSNPIFKIKGISDKKQIKVTVNGKSVPYYSSWDRTNNNLWVTINFMLKPNSTLKVTNI